MDSMLKSVVTIIACSDNPDKNTPSDIAAAIKDCQGEDVHVAENGVIEATVPTAALGDIAHMDGVRYIRPEMTFCTKDDGAE